VRKKSQPSSFFAYGCTTFTPASLHPRLKSSRDEFMAAKLGAQHGPPARRRVWRERLLAVLS